MKKLQFLMTGLAAVVVLILGSQTTSHALTLRLNDGHGYIVTVADNQSGDSDPAVGAITFSGTFQGSTVNVTASSKPVVGSAAFPTMVFNADVSNSSGVIGGIELDVEDSGFTPPPFTLFFLVSGTLNSGPFGNGAFGPFYDSNDNEDFTNLANFGGIISVAPGAFAGTNTGSFNTNKPFSLDIAAQFINCSGVSFNSSLQPVQAVPLPPTLLLLGSGLLGLGAIGWRQKKK